MTLPERARAALEAHLAWNRTRGDRPPSEPTAILALPPAERIAVVIESMERRDGRRAIGDEWLALEILEGQLLRSLEPATVPSDALADVLRALGRVHGICGYHWRAAWDLAAAVLDARGVEPALFEGLRAMQPAMTAHLSDKNARIAIDKALFFEAHLPIDLDACAAGVVKRDLRAMEPRERARWTTLVEHAMAGAQGEPKPGWLAKARKRIAGIGEAAFRERAVGWLEEIAARPQVRLSAAGADALRGLVWALGDLDDRPAEDAIAALGRYPWRRGEGWSPRHDRFVAAIAWALGEARDRERARPIVEALEARFRRTTAKYALAGALAKLGTA